MRSSGRSGGRVLFSFACVSRAALSAQRSSSVSRSGSATPWKISNCSQPGSFIASAQRALYACASSEPLPGAAVIVTTSRIAMASPYSTKVIRAPFFIAGIDALEGELTCSGCKLGPTHLVVSERRGDSERLGVEPDRPRPVAHEDPHDIELVVHDAQGAES